MELVVSSLSPISFITATKFPKIFLSPRSTITNKQQGKSRLPSSLTNTNAFQKPNNAPQVKKRRSANYHPSIWKPELLESLNTPYSYELHGTRLEELKQEARRLFVSTKDPCLKLKLIDTMQRLGVAYHFEEEIKEAISLTDQLDATGDLYITSLQFRLRRDYAFPVSSGVFDKFKSKNGEFMDSLSKDVAGLLSLYEACHHGRHGENVLEEAKNFSRKHLNSLSGKLEDDILAKQVQQSLEVPLLWRMPRIEAQNFIDIYTKYDSRSWVLLELAKLDYNLVQSLYQREIKELSRWWGDLGYKDKLSFARDRLMENYMWTMGAIVEPQFSKCRIVLTKLGCILTTIDDMYDIYGSLDELELFTDAVNRWDIKAMDSLPDYMKICYLAMFNFANEVAYDVMKDHDLSVISYLAEEWANLCESYLVEARWFYSKYTPTLDEYLKNAWISVGGHAGIVYAYMFLGCTVTKGSLDYFKGDSGLIYWSALITRLCDDLGTFAAESKRGDVTKSIHCYMIHEGASEEEAKHHVKGLISYSWKKLNEESAKCSLPKALINMSINMARTVQCIFQHGDGIGTSTGVTKDRLKALIVEPIPMIKSSNQIN